MEIDINKPIPSIQSIEGWKQVKIEENNEPFVSLNDFAPNYIQVKSQYFEQKIKGALEICYCRKGVAQKLVEAAKHLPKGYKFLIWDTWRPIEVQQALFDNYKAKLLKNNPSFERQIIQKETEKYVSLPSLDIFKPSPHLTGGAIDLTIIDEKGKNLDMGTGFDFFGEKAKTDFYELKCTDNNELTFRNNRRLIYNLLINFGFTNYPEEWWHYDYGNQFWAFASKTTAYYSLKLLDVEN